MKPHAYYNEFDPMAAEWLRELIKENRIAQGEVDTRDIRDVEPGDLRGFSQHHFFAGIGGWSLALRLAGWPDDRPVWTGSCPCQPFSAAGKKAGTSDERHLWPAWHWLISQSRPLVVFGEQVADATRHGWLDLVSTDMEGLGYSFGAAVLPASGVGAPHLRKRLWFVAYTSRPRRQGLEQNKRLFKREEKTPTQPKHPFTIPRIPLVGRPQNLLSYHGVPLQVARSALKGFGNAIVPQVACEFILAAEEVVSASLTGSEKNPNG